MDYMGRADDAKRSWMLNFVATLSRDGAAYMVGPSDVEAIRRAVQEFVDALAVVRTPNGRNPGSTANKNSARACAAAICRQYVHLIKYNAGIDDRSKILAGIRPPNVVAARINCPLAAPALSITAATNGAHTLSYLNPLELNVQRKPFGADGIILFRAIAPEPVHDLGQAAFYRKYTTNPMSVFFESKDCAKIATYFARWIGRRGDMSNPSPPVSMAIAA